MAKTIFITGASRGFGKLWAEALLQRGDKVIATARDIKSLDDLVKKYGNNILPLQLDVVDRAAGYAAIQKAKEHFGSIDVLINNAGYGLFGSVEETSEQDARSIMETNFFGLLWLTQAVLPIMRAQGHGHIIQVSSVVGLIGIPVLGVYNASKFAVEGVSETLATEVKGFGINITLVEPNSYSTDWGGSSASHAAAMPEYEGVKTAFYAALSDDMFGIPEATTPAMLKLIDSNNPPLRLFLGKYSYPLVKQNYESRMAEWDTWKEVADKAHGK
ncbi:short-chain dehydrogenase/reductase [Niastella yeongjuensis]|uniref:Short-chain dehydrogenase/reductase n=1 Tax=Niastella yeongjuensis TaxID=354355 RepID=A0A1V9EGB5_9BACT|nr:SDR family NAD(P)-dependent oxidoreductase [Niastella yeongjuensis]OQP45004.1 short-chain dehydrogenase/reductase [Niastella yeongjuensis]SEP49113.1 NADP-dependent 3-hydroxy acid dehydrogenase YdfG [Niastella yeongjuensis]